MAQTSKNNKTSSNKKDSIFSSITKKVKNKIKNADIVELSAKLLIGLSSAMIIAGTAALGAALATTIVGSVTLPVIISGGVVAGTAAATGIRSVYKKYVIEPDQDQEIQSNEPNIKQNSKSSAAKDKKIEKTKSPKKTRSTKVKKKVRFALTEQERRAEKSSSGRTRG